MSSGEEKNMMSVLNQSGEEQVECPLCMEPLEVDDLNFFPCTCGYQICRFCWHRIRTDENGLCPACRKAYPENPADFKPLTQEEVAKLKAEKRHKDQQRKQKITENRKHLANVRVVQRNLVFVVGLPMRLADSEVLKKHEYFGKFGKIHKVVINQSTSYAGSQGPSASAYVTYQKADDALRAIQAVNNIVVDGRTVKTSLGTTKYCSHFMKNQTCPKPDCMYLHDLGDVEASFTKEEMQQGKHQEYERKLHEQLLNSYNQGNKDRKPTPSPPSVALNSMNCLAISSSSGCCVSSSNPNTVQASQPCNKEAWPSLQPGVPSPGTNCSGTSTSTSSISSNSSSNSSTSSSNNGTGSNNSATCGISGSSTSHNGNLKERRQKFDHPSFNVPSKGNAQNHKKRHGVEDHRGKGKDKLHNPSQDEHSNKTVNCKSVSHNHGRANTKIGKDGIHDVQKMTGVARCQNQTTCDMNVASIEARNSNIRLEGDILDMEAEVKVTSGGEINESSISRGGSSSSRVLSTSHRAATLFEPDNNSFFSANSFTKVSASAAGSAGSDWPLSSLTLTHMPDVLPPVHSSEDWQAAFGFSNSATAVPMNQVESANQQVVSETTSSSSEYSGGKDGDACDAVSFDSQNGQQISVQGFNCHSSHSSSTENISSNPVSSTSADDYRLTEVGHINQKLTELSLEEKVVNGVISDDATGPAAGCETSSDGITLHSTANCENQNAIPCSQNHLYSNMPSPAFVQDPAVFMVNRHPFVQSANHVIPNGIQTVQAAKFLSEFHIRQQSQVQNSQSLPVHVHNHPVLEGTMYNRHLIESGANSKFVLNTNNFGSSGDGTNVLPVSKNRQEAPKLPNNTNSESEEVVSDNEKYSNYDNLERQTSCENSSDEFVDYNGDSENSVNENNEEMSPKENHRATDDDLGFDPFHETQKALAEMMEKENMMLMLQGQQNHVPHPSSHINHLNQLHQQYHQMNHINHHPAQFTQATMFGGTKILPSCHAPLQPHLLQNNHRLQANVAAVSACSKMDGLAMGPGPGPGSIPPRARLPPPGFTTAPNHMNAFGLGIPRAPSNTGSKILPFMGLGNGSNSSNTGTSSSIPPSLNSISTNISISSALNPQQCVNNVHPSPLLFPHSSNHTSTATQLNSTFNTQNGTVAHNSSISKTPSDSFNTKEWPENLRSLLPNINAGSGVSQSPVPVAFSGSNTPTPPSPPPPPPPASSQNSSYAVPPHAPVQTPPAKTWSGAGPCSDWTALDPAIVSSRPHSIFSSSSVTPQHPIILCNTNSVLNQQSPSTQYLHLQNTTHWLRSLASDGCLLYGANISQNMSNSDWTVQSHSSSIAPPPPGFSLRMTTQQTTIQNKLAVSASQEITKIESELCNDYC